MIVIDEGDANAALFAEDTDGLRYIDEFAVALVAGIVAQQMYAVAEAHREIGVAIVIEIARGATQAAALQRNPYGLRDVREPSATEIVKQATGTVRRRAHQEKIRLVVAVVVDEAGACTGAKGRGRSTGCGRHERLLLERYFDRWRRRRCRTAREFRERVAALIAVSRAERRAQMFGGDFLETCEMLVRRGGVTLALIGSRQTKFGRSVKRVGRKGFLEGRDGVLIMLRLRLQVAYKIEAVGFGSDLGNVLERSDSLFDFAGILVNNSQVVPSIGIARELACRFLKRGPSRLQLLLAEERDAEIESRHREFGVRGQCLLEFFLRVGELLLVHVGHTQSIETQRVGRSSVAGGARNRLGRGRLLLGARSSRAQ